ncbi:LURP-one-related [Dillenia turbinata]|uniref:LURP-one-related n=1 Tax=Dillenia turbinata TaxID=194707 RepID=A0AAN8W0V6_9MAGN
MDGHALEPNMQLLKETTNFRERGEMPIVSKIFCSSMPVLLIVRRRPPVVNGGGFVVTDCSQKVLFKVDGCGIVGAKGELILRDGYGEALLLIRRKGAMVEAVSIHRKWKAFSFNYEGSEKLVFSLKEPNLVCLTDNTIKITVEPRISKKEWDFEINGSFPNKTCSIIDHKGDNIAQVGVKELLPPSKDIYNVMIGPGIDQAFVFGVIAILDYIYDESTRC